MSAPIPTGLLCIDAASRRSGLALFSAHSRLLIAKAADLPASPQIVGDTARAFAMALERAERMGREIALVADKMLGTLPERFKPRRIIIEYPRIYKKGPGANIPTEDILVLAASAMAAWVNLAALFPMAGVEPVRPRDWKGQVKKEIMCDRIRARLDADELAVMSASEQANDNIIDAVGIGLAACSHIREKS